MANYTMTIAEMLSNPITRQIFPNNYEFYMDDEEARKSFENKFIQYYYYREIGFETPFIFIQKLETHLTVNMPYWKQLYETELEARDINFLLNKDLKETFIREIESNNEMTGTDTIQQNSTSTNSITQNGTSTSTTSASQNGTSTSTTSASQNGTSTSTTSVSQNGTSNSTTSVSQNGTSSTNHKESSLSDGVSSAILNDGYLTGISADTGTSSNEGTTIVSDTNETTGESSSEESNKSSGESSSENSNQTTGESSSENSNQTTGESSSVGSNESSGSSTKSENGKTAEKTELISQGNIGITSSAQLLKEWRDVLINMDKIIIESCNDLFMKIY